MAPVRLAVVADIHHGADTYTKRGSAALPLLETFVDRANGSGVDAVIDLGDRISDESVERDLELARDVAARFQALRVPRHHVSGNHDHGLLTPAQNEAILDAPTGTRAVTLGALRLAFWQPDVMLTDARGFHLAPGDLDALRALLAADDRPTLLVSHVPLSGHAQAGNYYFENNYGHSTYASDLGDIRRALAEAPGPLVVLSGHVHWNSLNVLDGVPHLTLQSLIETFTTGEPSNAVAWIAIEDDRLTLAVDGREPWRLTLPWHRTKPRWRSPLPCFSTRLAKPAVTKA